MGQPADVPVVAAGPTTLSVSSRVTWSRVSGGTGSSDTLDFSTTELVGINQIDGGAGNDTITGSAGDDIIVLSDRGGNLAKLIPPSSGTSGHPITYSADGTPTIAVASGSCTVTLTDPAFCIR